MSIWDKIPENEDDLESNPYYTKKGGKWIHNGLFWEPNVKNNFKSFYKPRKKTIQDLPLFDITDGKFLFEFHCAECHTLNLNKRTKGPYLRSVYNRKSRQVKNFRYQRIDSGITLNFDYLLQYMTDEETFKNCQRYPLTFVNQKQALSIIHYLMYLKTRSDDRSGLVVEEDIDDYGNRHLPFRHKRYPDDYTEKEKEAMQNYLKKTTNQRIKRRKQWHEKYGYDSSTKN